MRPPTAHSKYRFLLAASCMLLCWAFLSQPAWGISFYPGHVELDEGNTYTDSSEQQAGQGVQNDCHYLQNCGNSQSSSSGSSSGSSQGSSNSNPWPTGCCRPGS